VKDEDFGQQDISYAAVADAQSGHAHTTLVIHFYH
jgi:hypothetical protein